MMIEKKCPSCDVKTIYGQHAHFPFCSARCRDRDFIQWHDEKTVLSTPITDADEAMEQLDAHYGN